MASQRHVTVGGVQIGGGAPVAVQTMTKTETANLQATMDQIRRVADAGADVVRVAVPRDDDVEALRTIVVESPIPVIADIHFNHTLALKALDAGAHCVRLNPGNIGGPDKVAEVARRANELGTPMRIGVNSGSLPKHLHALERESPVEALVTAATEFVALMERLDFTNFKVSIKSTSVPNTIASNRLLAERIPYPLHLGITEAGTKWSGSLKSAVGLGTLLADGVGDTIRISLSTFHAEEEVKVAWEILKALKLRERGPVLIACPTCGRLQFDMDTVVADIEKRLEAYADPIEVAVLGCAVNGIGEASHADFGITGAKNEGLIFSRGKALQEGADRAAGGRAVRRDRPLRQHEADRGRRGRGGRGRGVARAHRGRERRRAHARAARRDGGGEGRRRGRGRRAALAHRAAGRGEARRVGLAHGRATVHARVGPMPSVAIVGAGFSGLGMAITLERAGFDDLTVFEKGDRVGGVWRENSYPGAACDVPSHVYSYSFAHNPGWSRRFGPQAEILAYLERCADEHGVRAHIRFESEVRRAAFDEAAGRWRLELAGGETHEADVLVTACGQLSVPAWPAIPGLDDFGGTLFHSARWDHEHDLTGDRVAVIGTGASAIQFVPAVQPRVSRLHVFQRSAPWVIPKWDVGYRRASREVFARVPGAQAAARLGMWSFFEAAIPGLLGREALLAPLAWSGKALLRRQVRDPELRAKLAPKDVIGCKRLLISSDWYRAIAQPNVALVTDGVREITASGVVTEDGTEREVDTIILGTGFRSHDFVAPMEIVGLGGRDLNEAWAAGARAYLGTAVPGFPNLFLMYGPNTNLGAGSIIYMLECQMRYVLDAVRALDRHAPAYLDVRPEALDAFDRELQDRLAGTVWATGCASWYVDESGRNANNWPGLQLEYRRRTHRLRPADWRLVRVANERAAVAA